MIILAKYYKSLKELPKGAQGLPKHAQEIYLEAFNNAWEQYKDPKERRDPSEDREQVAAKVAWSAVKKEYEKDEETGKWKKK